MRSLSFSYRLLLGGLLAAVGLLVVALVLVDTDPLSEVVDDPTTHEGWQSIEYNDIRVDVPATWTRVDMSDCEFEHERWAREGSAPCDFEDGVALYGSATFDATRGPGVSRTTENGVPIWGGYVIAGGSVVYAADRDRAVTRAVLDSVRRSGG